MVIKVWQLAAAFVLLVAGLPGAMYLTVHGHGAILVCFVILATTIWLGFDARKRDWSESRSRWRARNTATWVIGSLLLWVVVFPIYLAQRRRVPLKDDSEDVEPPAHEPSPPPAISTDTAAESEEAPRSTVALWLAAVCAGGMALGAIGPWARGPLGTTVNGLDGSNDGWILIGAAAITVLCLWLHRRSAGRGSLMLMLLAGLISGGVTLYDRQSGSTATGGSFDVVEVGWGVNLGLAASVGLVVCVLALFARRSSLRKARSDTVETWPEPIALEPPAPVSAATVSQKVAETREPEQRTTIRHSPPERSMIFGGIATELERLAVLHTSGALDVEEFRAAKAQLLQGPARPTPPARETPRRSAAEAELAGAAVSGAAWAYDDEQR